MNVKLGSIALIRDERIDRVRRTKEKMPDYSLPKKQKTSMNVIMSFVIPFNHRNIVGRFLPCKL